MHMMRIQELKSKAKTGSGIGFFLRICSFDAAAGERDHKAA
jgi:hypothetical protein